ncbi:hypothetical protein A8L34_11925 [Bacillus sp. FJAT-27264]|uniref:HEPN domain-containing protein n=1 Tax=Paenibacillus sp. (strain DSM 101736 / FJAT-27264) TaxID=1850362 RepID=UPI0008081797|nr:HEPN domain-containing protein [Bacillus sp. FJAT-27264]OBZ14623.1 hypothetical protein A8L34_11925 [Bacillus sp. FJAT-27264]
MDLKVEYLVIVETKNSFCSSIGAFNNLLKSHTDITISNGTLKYKEIEINYNVITEELPGKNERYFHLYLSSNSENISDFETILKVLRGILFKACSNHVQTLWDDISFYYANKAYPLIYQIENLMRKLITKFMLTNVGLGWVKENIPDEVRTSIRSEKKEDTPDYLYKTDFIQLANFLFKKYSPYSQQALLEIITKLVEEEEGLETQDLKKYLPQSNWERYFSNIVDCEHEYLNKRWSQLYDLRCKIAHNNTLNLKDYTDIILLVSEIKEKLEKAIESLDKVEVPEEDRETVVENIVSNSNDITMEFFNSYKLLDEIIFMLAQRLLPNNELEDRRQNNLRSILRKLSEHEMLNEGLIQEILHINKFRNELVHTNRDFKVQEVDYELRSIRTVISEVERCF